LSHGFCSALCLKVRGDALAELELLIGWLCVQRRSNSGVEDAV
jgi:hypothetical protein